MNDRGILLMIVDDDEDIREVAKLLLEVEGYRVKTAADGEDAWRQVNASERPALILLDLMMPRMDGEQFMRALRTSTLGDIRVVIMSGHNLACDKARELHADDWLTKPTDLDELLRTIRRCLDQPTSAPPGP
jgi:CheY-like chemotaxis protein